MDSPVSTDNDEKKGIRIPAKALKQGGAAVLAIVLLLIAYSFFRPETKVDEGPGLTAEFPENSFRVLIVVDRSEESRDFGYSALRGARAIASKLNENGGIREHPVAVRLMQVGVSEEEIFENLHRMLTAQPIQLLIDATAETVSPGAVRAAHETKTLTMILRDGACRTGSRLPEGKVSPYVWAIGLTRESTLEPFLTFLSEKRSKPESDFHVLFLGGDTPLDQDVIDSVRHESESLGFKTVDALIYDIRLNDFYSVARDILSRLPDVVFVSNRMQPSRLFMEQAYKLSLVRDMAIAGYEVFSEEWSKNFGKFTEGVYTVGRYAAGVNTAESKEFISYLTRPPKDEEEKLKGKLKQPNNPDASAASAWSAIAMVAQVMSHTPSLDYTKIQKKMEESEFFLPNGRAFFNPKNHVLVQKMFALRVKGGKYELIEELGDAQHPETFGCN